MDFIELFDLLMEIYLILIIVKNTIGINNMLILLISGNYYLE